MEKQKSITPLHIFVAFVLGILVAGILSNLQFTRESVWNDKFECDLILEQGVGCYKGCQHYPDNSPSLGENYNACIDFCENKYYTEFDDEGHISFCEYSHS